MSASITAAQASACWVNAMSWTDMDNYLGRSTIFDAKTERAFNRVMLRLRMTASIQFDDRILCQIANCTIGFWTKKVWPQIQDFFEIQDGRLSHPDVQPLRRAQRHSPAAQSQPAGKSPAHQRAANIRFHGTPEGRSGLSLVPQSHAERMQPDAETHAISTPDASILHENNAPADATGASAGASNASPDAFETHGGASASAGASSLSLSDSDLSESSQIHRGSFREREDARDASDAPAHAERMQSDASPHGRAHANRMRSDAPEDAKPHGRRGRSGQPAKPPVWPMTSDWQPSAESVLEARKRGIDVDQFTAKFRDHYLGTGEIKADWNGPFRNWCRSEKVAEGQRQQGSMMMGIPGKKPAPEANEDVTPQAIKLRRAFGDADYRAWLSDLVVGELDEDGVMTVTVPGAFRRDYVKQHFMDRLYQLFREDQPELLRMVVEAAPTERRQSSGR